MLLETKNIKNRLLTVFIISYGIAIAVMCFWPQPALFDGKITPNIIKIGRLRLLLIPFNSFVSLPAIHSLSQLVWLFLQNAMNVLLLYPLGLAYFALKSKKQTSLKLLILGFTISLSIEVTQLILDLLLDANRVFEVDDLMTNTFGIYLAYQTIKKLGLLKE